VVDARQRVIPLPSAEIPVQCAARRQVLGDRPPLAAGAEDVQQPVNQRPLVHAALVAAALGGRNERREHHPFRIRQITRIA